jgi:hypothetical protein
MLWIFCGYFVLLIRFGYAQLGYALDMFWIFVQYALGTDHLGYVKQIQCWRIWNVSNATWMRCGYDSNISLLLLENCS